MAKAGLKLAMLLPQTPKYLRLYSNVPHLLGKTFIILGHSKALSSSSILSLKGLFLRCESRSCLNAASA